jgi:hypothetical protein
MSNSDKQTFYTDAQLCERWQCSHMRLWRMRSKGELCRPVRIGASGRINLTPRSEVERLEAGGSDARAA